MNNINEYITQSLSHILLQDGSNFDFGQIATHGCPLPALKLMTVNTNPFTQNQKVVTTNQKFYGNGPPTGE